MTLNHISCIMQGGFQGRCLGTEMRRISQLREALQTLSVGKGESLPCAPQPHRRLPCIKAQYPDSFHLGSQRSRQATLGAQHWHVSA